MENGESENSIIIRSSPDREFAKFLSDIYPREFSKKVSLNKIYRNDFLKKEKLESIINFSEELNIKIIIKKDYESEFINNRLDSYITDLFRESPREDSEFSRILSRISRVPARNVPMQPTFPEDRRKTFTSRRGLNASSWVAPHGLEISVNGQRVIEEGDKYTRVDFTPGGRIRFDESKITDSIANGIKGLIELVAAIDRGEATLEPVFVGTTNINMALISQRLGFKIADSCRKQDGTIDKSRGSFQIVGRLEDIRQKLDRFTQSGLDQRIIKRDVRLKQRSQPA